MNLLRQIANQSTHLAKLHMVTSETILGDIWWSLMPGKTVSLKWPKGWTRVDENGYSCESADPNDHWRPWLEQNVGRQNWDWGWRANLSQDSVDVKFRRGYYDKMTLFLLRYA